MGQPQRAPSASSFRQVQVIALTSFKEGDLIKNALEAGAIGYLLKDVSADDLVQAIRAAHTPAAPHSLRRLPRPWSRQPISRQRPAST